MPALPRTPRRPKIAACFAASALIAALPSAAVSSAHHAGASHAEKTDQTKASLQTETGQSAGTVTFEQTDNGTLIKARLEGLSEGRHAVHIHEKGACEPDFSAAGGHYAPRDTKHGFDSEHGYHAGDLPNIYADEAGRAKADFFTEQLSIGKTEGQGAPFALNDANGSAIMIHKKGDDYEANPPGSSGPRVACGVIFAAAG